MTKVFFFIAPPLMVCGSILLALLLERLDTALYSVAEAERRTQLTSFGILAKIQPRDLNRHLSAPHEYFHSFATLLIHATSSAKILQITSAVPSAGKTTIACNLARMLAEGGHRVLLIDADLRRPHVHDLLGLPNNLGLSTLLEGKCTLEEVLQRALKVPLLDILTSGPVPPFPSLLLNSDAMRTLLKRCRKVYSHILLDSPPVLSAAEGITLATQAEAVVLVIRHGNSALDILRARDLLLHSEVSITGFVLNATPTRRTKITLE